MAQRLILILINCDFLSNTVRGKDKHERQTSTILCTIAALVQPVYLIHWIVSRNLELERLGNFCRHIDPTTASMIAQSYA
jgi:hypothetical protein